MEQESPVSLSFAFDVPLQADENGQNEFEMLLAEGSGVQQSMVSPSVQPKPKKGPEFQQRSSIGSSVESDIAAQRPSIRDPQAHESTPADVFLNLDDMDDQTSKEDENLPTWGDLRTKAGKERKRLPLACIACRRKKIKCSGEKPACKHCVRARVPCVYRVTARKAAPRTDYMAMLDKRLKRMEDRVIKMIPREELPDLSATGRSSVKPPAPGQSIKKEKGPTSKRTAEEAFDVELDEWKQSSNLMSVKDPQQSRSQREVENKLSTEGSEALPSLIFREHLAELFFDCVYGQSYLLLHKPSFMRKLKAGKIPPVLVLAVCAISARFSTHPQISTEPAFLRGKQWATAARNIIEKRHFEPNITILTAMLILGLHYFGTCEGGLSWSFGGQAMRLGYALQLHRELDHDPLGGAEAQSSITCGGATSNLPVLSFTDREIRRRLMWACYLMDIFNSSGTERPSFLNEEYIRIQLPIKESLFQLEVPGLTEDLDGNVAIPKTSKSQHEQVSKEARSNLGVAAYVIRAVVIWKRIVQYLNLGGKEKDPYPIWDDLSQFASLQRQIAQLKQSLPNTLHYTPGNLAIHVSERLANQFLFLHIVIAQTSLFLHRFAIPTAPNVHRPYPPNTPKAFLTSCATTVVQAASQVSHLIADSTGHTLTVPFAGYCAYASATVHVWGIFSRHPSLEASSKDNLRHNYRYLTRMKKYWGMFHYMAESIKDIYRAFANAAGDLKDRQLQPTADPSQPRSELTNVANLRESDSMLDNLTISVAPSRAASPSAANVTDADLDEDDVSPSTLNTNTNPIASESGHSQSRQPSMSSNPTSPSNTDTPTSGKLMLQYGDWFNRYPHGVSANEWEASHLPHKRDTGKGAEAVMSQRSELQSVEEFFATLSPASKAATAATAAARSAPQAGSTGQNRPSGPGERESKVAKRRGRKSVVDDIGTTTSDNKALQQQQLQKQQQQHPKSSHVHMPDQNQPPSRTQNQPSARKASETSSKPRLSITGSTKAAVPHTEQPISHMRQKSRQLQQPSTQQFSRVTSTSIPTTSTTQSKVHMPSSFNLDQDASDIDIPFSDFSTDVPRPLRSQHGTGFDLAEESPAGSESHATLPQRHLTSDPSLMASNRRSYLDFEYNSPSNSSNPGSVANRTGSNQIPLNFSYTSGLPQLDQKMVFDAYAGLDPSRTNSSSALNNPNNLDFWSNPWEGPTGIDLDGLSSIDNMDAGYFMQRPASSTLEASRTDQQMASNAEPSENITSDLQQRNNPVDGMSSAAWFMPFNIEPPTFEGFDDFGLMNDVDMSGVDTDAFLPPLTRDEDGS